VQQARIADPARWDGESGLQHNTTVSIEVNILFHFLHASSVICRNSRIQTVQSAVEPAVLHDISPCVCIRRITVTDGSYSPPVMTSSAKLRARRSSSSGGSSGAAAGQPIEFNPPTAEWQYELDQVFNIPIQRTHRGSTSNPPRSFTPNTPPRRVKQVAGDGNCLFRALSYWICGSEDYHLEVGFEVY